MRLLLIEDNQRLADYLATALQNGGFAVDHVSTTADADGALATTHYDTLLLDLGLPDMDGLIWLGHQRRRQMTRPVLVLTARDSLEDLVAGLNQGADDYLRKPFEIDELIARIRALLRRPGEALGVKLTAGNVSFDTSDREVTVNGVPVEFGRREMDGLELLMRRAGRVVPKSAIEDAIYSFGEDLASNAIEVWSTGFADACRMQGQTCTSTRCVAWGTCSQIRPPVPSQQKPSASLWLRLIVGLVSVSLLAVGAASAALYVRFKAKNLEFREQTLRNQAGVIADYLRTAPDAPIELPAEVTEAFKVNNGRYAIVDRYGELLAASPGVTAPLAAIGEPRHLFVLQPDQEQQPFFGLSVKTPFGDELGMGPGRLPCRQHRL